MKKFIQEFKDFIMRGNVVDMAVGVIVGSALTSIVNSLVDNLINPFIVFITGGQTTISGLVVPGTHIDFGAFLSSIINFLIVAFIVFLLVKGINTLKKAGGELIGISLDEKPETIARCPLCYEKIDQKALRCPHCTQDIKDREKIIETK